MAMNDEERLHQDLGLAIFHTAGRFTNERDRMAAVIDELRTMGHTITARPAPEPTYTRTFTDAEWNVVVLALNELRFNEDAIVGLRNRADLLFAEIRNIEPDPEPGA